MANGREPTLEDMRQLGAGDGRALAEALAFYVRGPGMQRHIDEMLETVHHGIMRMVDDLRTGGLSDDLVRAYGMACSEAITHEMACHARVGRQHLKSA